MKEIFYKLCDILGSERAALKLMIIRYGIDVDGLMFARQINDYPEKFRTKRFGKKTKLVSGQLFDIETRDVPWIPVEFFIELNGKKSVVKTNFRAGSTFKTVIENGAIFIVSNELRVKISASIPARHKLQDKIINGFPADQFVQVLGADRIAVLGYDGCAGWFTGKQCKFCDSCAPRKGEVTARPSLNDLNTRFTNNAEQWLSEFEPNYLNGIKEAYSCILADDGFGPHHHLHVMAGNMADINIEWQYMLRLSKALSEVKKLSEVDSYLNLIPPSKTDYLENAFELGFQNLLFNLEVFKEERFRYTCPDKHHMAPYTHFIEMMKQAVEIFGAGKIRCGFVLGAQPVEELKEGCRQLADYGIVSDYTVFTPKTGTPWSKKEQPDVIEIAEFAAFLKKIYQEYNFSTLYCEQSSRSAIMNELIGDK